MTIAGQVRMAGSSPSGFPVPFDFARHSSGGPEYVPFEGADWGLLTFLDSDQCVLVDDPDLESGAWKQIIIGGSPRDYPGMQLITQFDWACYLWNASDVIDRRAAGIPVSEPEHGVISIELCPGQWEWTAGAVGATGARYEGRWIGPVRGIRSVDRLMNWSAPPDRVVPFRLSTGYERLDTSPHAIGNELVQILFGERTGWAPSGDPLIKIPRDHSPLPIPARICGPLHLTRIDEWSAARALISHHIWPSPQWISCFLAVCETILRDGIESIPWESPGTEEQLIERVSGLYDDISAMYPAATSPDGSYSKGWSPEEVSRPDYERIRHEWRDATKQTRALLSKRLEIASREASIETCESCFQEITWTRCRCGAPAASFHHGHRFVPNGCICSKG